MKITGAIVIGYSLMVLLGGLAGYLFAGSLVSLLTGSICGALLFAGGIGLFYSSVLAFFTALSVTALLSLFFLFRYFQTYQLVPSGMMAGLSLIVLLLLLTTKAPRKVNQ